MTNADRKAQLDTLNGRLLGLYAAREREQPGTAERKCINEEIEVWTEERDRVQAA